jgi:hypothetical protein
MATGRWSELPESLKLRPDVRFRFEIADFQRLVAFLRGTRYEVPAPFHVLKGSTTIALSSDGEDMGPSPRFKLSADTALAAGRQRLAVSVDGVVVASNAFTSARTVHAQAEAVLKDVALELPTLRLAAPPAFTPDPRIMTHDQMVKRRAEKAAEEAEAEISTRPAKAPFMGVVHIRTEKPALLLTNLARGPVPVALDLTARAPGGELTGTIDVRRFDADLFRRTATIDRFKVIEHPGTTSPELDGKIAYHADVATIDILVLGTAETPQIEFQSSPPLPRDQIIGLLLFGKAPSDLEPDQTQSVGNFSGALSDQAFGLATLFLFASTPIEYVGYNPVSQTYTVRLRLPGGVSAEMGSVPGESAQLTFRKRVARNIVVETQLESSRTTGNAVSTFLKWFKRY